MTKDCRKTFKTMIDLSTKSVCVVDNGLFVALAERLVGDFKRVGYFYSWQSGFPDGRELVIGEGLQGVERIKYLWNVIDEFDLFVFPDVWDGDLQEYLRDQGKLVWGTGHGSEVELARWKTRQRFSELGLDENPTTLVTGTDALREFFKKKENQFVKISAYRGIGETWLAKDYELAEGQICDIEHKCGALAKVLDFICEDAIPDAKEVGYDGFCIDGQFPDVAMVGIEKKDQSYFGRLCKYDDLPENVRAVNDKMAAVMSQFNYRQFFSTEIREKGKKAYLIDVTARQASPAGEVYCGMFKNLAEILWEGAQGRIVNPKSDYEYGAQILLCSEWYGLGNWIPLRFPEEIRPFVKIYNHCRIHGVDYAVPQLANMKQVGSVVAFGNTPKEAVDKCKEMADQIEGYDLDTEADSLDEAVKEMETV
jgi:hypothetical protein